MTTINPFDYSDAAHTPDKGAWVEIGHDEWASFIGDIGVTGKAGTLHHGVLGDPDHLAVSHHYWKWVPHATPSRVSILEDMVEQALPWVADGAYLCRLGTLPPWVSKAGDSVGPPALDKQWTFLRTRLPLSQYVAGDRCGDAGEVERLKADCARIGKEFARNLDSAIGAHEERAAAESESARLRVENERLAEELVDARVTVRGKCDTIASYESIVSANERIIADLKSQLAEAKAMLRDVECMIGGEGSALDRAHRIVDQRDLLQGDIAEAQNTYSDLSRQQRAEIERLEAQLATVTAQLAAATKAGEAAGRPDGIDDEQSGGCIVRVGNVNIAHWREYIRSLERRLRERDAEHAKSLTGFVERAWERGVDDRLTTLESRVSALESAAKGVR